MSLNNLLATFSRRCGSSTERTAAVEAAVALSNAETEVAATSADARLRTALDENKRLRSVLQTVRHNAGNHLALLAAMLARQGRASENPLVQQALQTAQGRVSIIAETMRLDRLGEDSEFVSAKALVERVVAGLSEYAANAQIRIDVDVQDLMRKGDEAISLMLIVNEVAVNSLKHAFPDNMTGVIGIRGMIEPSVRGNSLVLVVEDDGIGQPRDSARAGFGATVISATAQSLGAKVIEERRYADGERLGSRTTIVKACP